MIDGFIAVTSINNGDATTQVIDMPANLVSAGYAYTGSTPNTGSTGMNAVFQMGARDLYASLPAVHDPEPPLAQIESLLPSTKNGKIHGYSFIASDPGINLLSPRNAGYFSAPNRGNDWSGETVWSGMSLVQYSDISETSNYIESALLIEGITGKTPTGQLNVNGDPSKSNAARRAFILSNAGLDALLGGGGHRLLSNIENRRPGTDTSRFAMYETGDVAILALSFTGWNSDTGRGVNPKITVVRSGLVLPDHGPGDEMPTNKPATVKWARQVYSAALLGSIHSIGIAAGEEITTVVVSTADEAPGNRYTAILTAIDSITGAIISTSTIYDYDPSAADDTSESRVLEARCSVGERGLSYVTRLAKRRSAVETELHIALGESVTTSNMLAHGWAAYCGARGVPDDIAGQYPLTLRPINGNNFYFGNGLVRGGRQVLDIGGNMIAVVACPASQQRPDVNADWSLVAIKRDTLEFVEVRGFIGSVSYRAMGSVSFSVTLVTPQVVDAGGVVTVEAVLLATYGIRSTETPAGTSTASKYSKTLLSRDGGRTWRQVAKDFYSAVYYLGNALHTTLIGKTL